MQLILISIALFFFVIVKDLNSQVTTNTKKENQNLKNSKLLIPTELTYERPEWKSVEIDILSSYYEQDGNNSPVTGGIGTELLTDFTQKIMISMPLTEKISLSVDGGYDYYSSASTDNIDNVRSSDSAQDMRIHGNIGVIYQLSELQSINARFGGSTEYDYLSANGGIGYSILSRDKNTSLSLSAQAFIDKWDLIYPKELRGQGKLFETDQRQSYNASLNLTQVITKRWQLSFQLEGTYMKGLLSTPFHRVYFSDRSLPDVERLPNTRLKIPVGVRMNYYLSDWLISRIQYRYYWDDWGMSAHSVSLETPIKINRFLSIAPVVRYHWQNGIDYFMPYARHQSDATYFTSDFDLSTLKSISLGVGINYQPSGGLAKIKIPFSKRSFIRFKSIDIKYANYQRSTELRAQIISLGIGISI